MRRHSNLVTFAFKKELSLEIALDALGKILDDNWNRGGVLAHTDRSLAMEAIDKIKQVEQALAR